MDKVRPLHFFQAYKDIITFTCAKVAADGKLQTALGRSEERRVGKECRSLCDWSSDVCSSDLPFSDVFGQGSTDKLLNGPFAEIRRTDHSLTKLISWIRFAPSTSFRRIRTL